MKHFIRRALACSMVFLGATFVSCHASSGEELELPRFSSHSSHSGEVHIELEATDGSRLFRRVDSEYLRILENAVLFSAIASLLPPLAIGLNLVLNSCCAEVFGTTSTYIFVAMIACVYPAMTSCISFNAFCKDRGGDFEELSLG